MLSKDCASEDYEISGPVFCVVIPMKLEFKRECPSLKVYFYDFFGQIESVLNILCWDKNIATSQTRSLKPESHNPSVKEGA